MAFFHSQIAPKRISGIILDGKPCDFLVAQSNLNLGSFAAFGLCASSVVTVLSQFLPIQESFRHKIAREIKRKFETEDSLHDLVFSSYEREGIEKVRQSCIHIAQSNGLSFELAASLMPPELQDLLLSLFSREDICRQFLNSYLNSNPRSLCFILDDFGIFSGVLGLIVELVPSKLLETFIWREDKSGQLSLVGNFGTDMKAAKHVMYSELSETFTPMTLVIDGISYKPVCRFGNLSPQDSASCVKVLDCTDYIGQKSVELPVRKIAESLQQHGFLNNCFFSIPSQNSFKIDLSLGESLSGLSAVDELGSVKSVLSYCGKMLQLISSQVDAELYLDWAKRLFEFQSAKNPDLTKIDQFLEEIKLVMVSLIGMQTAKQAL